MSPLSCGLANRNAGTSFSLTEFETQRLRPVRLIADAVRKLSEVLIRRPSLARDDLVSHVGAGVTVHRVMFRRRRSSTDTSSITSADTSWVPSWTTSSALHVVPSASRSDVTSLIGASASARP